MKVCVVDTVPLASAYRSMTTRWSSSPSPPHTRWLTTLWLSVSVKSIRSLSASPLIVDADTADSTALPCALRMSSFAPTDFSIFDRPASRVQ